jgi:hypothetical protein
MTLRISAACAALAALLVAVPAAASAIADIRPPDVSLAALPQAFLQFFYHWKSEPKDLQFSDLRVLNAGGDLRVMCGAYAVPGQTRRPFLVLGDASPTASAAWEPGSFPETDPLYPQLMNDLRLCQSMGVVVTASR